MLFFYGRCFFAAYEIEIKRIWNEIMDEHNLFTTYL